MLGIGRALRSAGWEVRFASGPTDGRPEDRQPDGGFKFDGFEYVPLGEAESVNRALRARGESFLRRGQRSIRWLEKEKATSGDVVIAYNVTSPQLVRLRRWCVARNISLIVDCVEWYEPSHLSGGVFGPLRLAEELRMRVFNKRVDGLIAISRYLESYYSSGTLDVLCVPPLVDLTDPKWRAVPSAERTAKTTFVYAGNPGKKDLFGNVLRACSNAAEAGARLRLVVAGPSRAQVEAALRGEGIPMSALNRWIETLGWLEQTLVPGLLARADFSILARPPLRYAMAGFPTKVVESLAAGTPPVLNITSDLAEFIKDGENGIVAWDQSVTALTEAIRRGISMDRGAKDAMRARARRTAETCFDYRVFIDALGAFVGKVAERRRRRSVEACAAS